MLGDARQNVGEPGLRIDVVHLGRDDQAVHHRGPLAATVRAAEQPGFSPQCDTAHAALGGVVGQADAAIVEEARERDPALEHVVHGLGDIVAAREFGALFAHPGFQVGHQRCAEFLAYGLALFRALTVDRSLRERDPWPMRSSSKRRSCQLHARPGIVACRFRGYFGTTRGTLRNERRLIQAAELFNEREALAVAVRLDSFAEGKPVTRVSFKEYPLGDARDFIFDTPS